MSSETNHSRAADSRAADLLSSDRGAMAPVRSALTAPKSGHAADLLELSGLWATLRRGRRIIWGTTLVVFAGVAAWTLTSRMAFRASGRLYLGELHSKSKAASSPSTELELTGSGPGEVGSEIEIIRSRSLVTRAVLASGLNVSIVSSDAGPLRYYRWLAARRDPGLLDATVPELRAVDTTLAGVSVTPRRYQVRFETSQAYELWAGDVLLGRGKLGEAFKTRDVNLLLVDGTERQPRPGAHYDVVVSPLEDTVERALKELNVNAPRAAAGGEPLNVVSLEFADTSPYLAATFLDRLMVAYLRERQSWKTEDAAAAEAFVTKQLESMRGMLDRVQQQLADYRSNHRVVVLDNEAKAMIEQIGKYEEQRVAARLQVAALNDIKRALQGPNPPIGAFLLGEANDTVLEEMGSTLSQARQKLAELETRFSDAAPDVREQRSSVEAQLAAVRNYVSSRLARAQENLSTLNGIIGQFETKLKSVPGAELGLAQLSRESEVYSRTYSYLLERQQQTAIIKASTLSKNRVLDAPQIPHRENSPKLPLRLAGGALGLLLGAALVIARSLLSGAFQSEGEVRSSVGLPVLASVPRRSKAKRRGADSIWAAASGKVEANFLEAFRALRTNLYRLGSHRGTAGLGRIILISSAEEGDGKTTCAVWLARALASDRKRVLLIDADLRRAGSDGSSRRSGGLRAVLNRQAEWRAELRRDSGEFGAGQRGEFLALSSGGATRPELLSTEPMHQLLDEARAEFDYILLDSPSFPAVCDAAVLALRADAVVSVVRPLNTPRRAAFEHLSRLSVDAPVHAIVVNDAGPAPRKARDRSEADARGADPIEADLQEAEALAVPHVPS